MGYLPAALLLAPSPMSQGKMLQEVISVSRSTRGCRFSALTEADFFPGITAQWLRNPGGIFLRDLLRGPESAALSCSALEGSRLELWLVARKMVCLGIKKIVLVNR